MVRFFFMAQIRVLPLLRRSVALGARTRALAMGHGSIAVRHPLPGREEPALAADLPQAPPAALA